MSTVRGEQVAHAHPGEDVLRDEVADDPNILLLAPSLHQGRESMCADLLGIDDREAVDILFVTSSESPSDRLSAMRAHVDGAPAKIGFVRSDDRAESGPGKASPRTPCRVGPSRVPGT